MNAKGLADLFRRDLRRLQQQIEAFRCEEDLWRTLPGISNSAGNLALHLEGNLREFVGRLLGALPYTRVRELEFSTKGVPAAELLVRIKALQEMVPSVLERLTSERLAEEFRSSCCNGRFR